MLEDVVQTVLQDDHHLELVPDAQRAQHGRAGHGQQGVESHKSADRHLPLDHQARAHPKKQSGGKEAHGLDGAVVRHDDEIAAKAFSRQSQKLVEHGVAEGGFGGRGLDGFDAFNGVNLLGAVFGLALFEVGEKRSEDFDREIHQAGV